MEQQNQNVAVQPLSREEVSAEVERAATDPTHPQHVGYKLQNDAYNKWANDLYSRIPGMGGKIEISPSIIGPDGLSKTTGLNIVDSSKDSTAQAAHVELQKQVAEAVAQRGIDPKVVQGESAALFAGKQGQELIDLLDDRTLAGLTPDATQQAHVAMASWMNDLAALRKSATPADSDPDIEPISQSDFEAKYVEELHKRRINVEALDNAIDGIFAGRPELYKHFLRQLDKFPASQRLAAYVRSAEAVMYYVRLRQYVS